MACQNKTFLFLFSLMIALLVGAVGVSAAAADLNLTINGVAGNVTGWYANESISLLACSADRPGSAITIVAEDSTIGGGSAGARCFLSAGNWEAPGTYLINATVTGNATFDANEINYYVTVGDRRPTECDGTRTLIFVAFGLISLLAIVGAAYALINIQGLQNFSAIATMLIGLGIIIMAGFVIISSVGVSACG